MKKQFLYSIGGLSMLGLVASAADAAPVGTVSILPSVFVPFPGDTLVLSVVGTGFEDNADAGDFKVTWDPSVLSYVGITIANPPWDTQFVDDANADTTGTLNSVFLGTSTFGGVGPDFDIATLSFTVVGNPGDSTVVSATDAVVGWFAPGAVPIDVTYRYVPIPAAIWLLGSGLLGLVGLTRNREKECLG